MIEGWQLSGLFRHTTGSPVNVFNAFRFALPGESGVRNTIRGNSYFGIDMGLARRSHLPYGENHSLQFRWEASNVTNSMPFDAVANAPELDQITAFGKYTGLLTNPQIMQIALRYEF